MTDLRIGSLCSGYGGLDMAVEAVLGGSLAWWSDIDDGAIRIMSHHHPGVPNLGDFTLTDWSQVEPVEVVTAGYPCQPFSHAGKRKGTKDERHLWPYVRAAIRGLRPRLVVLENVAGHRSLGFGRVLGDLAEDGFDAEWVSPRASDVGACHERERVFILACPTGQPWSEWNRDGGAAADAHDLGHHDSLTAPGAVRHVEAGNGTLTEVLGGHLFPTPRASDGEKGGPGQRGSSGDLMLPSAVALLPTPKASDGEFGTPSTSGRGRDKSTHLSTRISLLPTPTATPYGNNQSASEGAAVRPSLDTLVPSIAVDWGKYETAVRRHEVAFGLPVPTPVQAPRKGAPQLAPVFSEWMMGLPAGHVTNPAIWDGLTDKRGKPASAAAKRNAMLRACGNGVIPRQAEFALRIMLSRALEAAA